MIMSLIQINKANSVNNIISVPMGEDVKLKESSSKELLGKFKFFPDEPKLNKKFIKNVERLVRSSLAYKEYCRYLNEDQGLINDVHNFNITNEVATLEYHHYPFTLYDIVEILLNKIFLEGQRVTSIELAEEVLKLHYKNMVGLVHLDLTNHELVHAGKIFIPLDSVFGRVNTFVDQYKPYMFDEQIERYNNLVELTEKHMAKLPPEDQQSEPDISESSQRPH